MNLLCIVLHSLSSAGGLCMGGVIPHLNDDRNTSGGEWRDDVMKILEVPGGYCLLSCPAALL